MMRTALIGGSGFIGQWILRSAPEAERFVVVDRAPPPEDTPAQVEYRQADVLAESVESLLDEVDSVVLLAAVRPKARWYDEAARDYATNVSIATRTFDACYRRGITNVVFTSTISVYGEQNRVPFDEHQVPQPGSYYGLAKVASERVAQYLNRDRSMGIKCLRLAHVVGAGEREEYMFMKFVRAAARKETIQVYGHGEGRREYVYVKDVAGAVMEALRHGGAGGVFNVGTGVNISHRELAEMINSVFGNDGNLEMRGDQPEDREVDRMAVTKAANQLGWRAVWTLRQALEDIHSIVATSG